MLYISHTLGFVVRYVGAAFIAGVTSVKIVKDVQVTVAINRSVKLKRSKASTASDLRLTLRRLAMAGEQTHALYQAATKEIEQDSCLVGCDTV